jgi:hypothetical protein
MLRGASGSTGKAPLDLSNEDCDESSTGASSLPWISPHPVSCIPYAFRDFIDVHMSLEAAANEPEILYANPTAGPSSSTSPIEVIIGLKFFDPPVRESLRILFQEDYEEFVRQLRAVSHELGLPKAPHDGFDWMENPPRAMLRWTFPSRESVSIRTSSHIQEDTQ